MRDEKAKEGGDLNLPTTSAAGIVRAEELKPASWLLLGKEQSTGLVDVDDFASFDAARRRDMHDKNPTPCCDRRVHRAPPYALGLSVLLSPSVLLVPQSEPGS
jgi:hypothetical protein